MKHAWLLWLALSGLCAGACGDSSPKAAVGEYCQKASECESGLCSATDSVCTVACSEIGKACAEHDGFVCRENKQCGQPCDSGSDDGTALCRDGVLKECKVLGASECESCGCELFGGGICDTGVGCVQPAELAGACKDSQFCKSGTCDPETHKCITARKVGEACHWDEQCETDNCSNDGSVENEGVCNNKLGTKCDNSKCSACELGAFDERCGRKTCDPEKAPNCGQGWSCEATSEGGHACYERCNNNPEYACYGSFATCQGDFCW